MTTVVAVRARPISDKSKSKGERSCLQVSANGIKVTGPSGANASLPIGLNLCKSTQDEVWAKFGEQALDQVIAGFNVNTVMFGAQGTGHKYAAFGTPPFPLNRESGLLPRACQAIFQKISAKASGDTKYLVEVGMMQLSKDSIRDMLCVESNDALKITAGDPEKVPEVEGLTQLAVDSYEQLAETLQAAITRSAAEFNGQPPGTTSRRQFIVQLHVTQVHGDKQTPSLWNLMVLSAASTQVSNKSLSEFQGLVSALVEGQKPTGSTNLFKYLDNSIGANAKTFMLTSISQTAIDFHQIVDTLKFGAKMLKVKHHAAVKEFPADPSKVSQWAARLEQTRSRTAELFGSKDAQQVDQRRGKVPHLENLHDDNLLSRQLIYFLSDGETRIGRADATIKQTVILSGLGILSSHCIIQNAAGRFSITACSGAKVIHNGTELVPGKVAKLAHNDRLRLGSYATFRVVIPSEAGKKGHMADKDVTYSFVESEINEQAASQLAASTKGLSAEVSERIQNMLPLVNEANSISEELHKGIAFELKLFAKITNKSKGSGGREMDMNVQLTFEDNDMEDILWDCDTFTDRLYEMRDMCNSFLDNGGDLVYLEKNYSGENDPFFIKGNEQMIGRSLIYLDPINHLLPISSKTPIIDYNGFSRGMLDMTLIPSLPKLSKEKMESKFDELETVDKMVGKQLRISLTIKGVKGIPSTLSKEVNVKYRFFMDESYSVTPKSKEKSINPKFNHSQDWNLVVDDELVQYLATDVLEIEVYGSSDAKTPKKNAQYESESKTSESKTSSKLSGHAMAAAAALHKAANDTRMANMMNDMDTENAATAAALAELGSKEEEIEELRFQLQETKMDMQQKLREQEARLAAVSNKEEMFKAKLEAKDELAKRVAFAEAKLEKAEDERDDLQRDLNDARDQLRQAELRLQEAKMKLDQQELELRQLQEDLEKAGQKSKACVIL